MKLIKKSTLPFIFHKIFKKIKKQIKKIIKIYLYFQYTYKPNLNSFYLNVKIHNFETLLIASSTSLNHVIL